MSPQRWTLAINEQGSMLHQWVPGCTTVEVMPVAEHEALMLAQRETAQRAIKAVQEEAKAQHARAEAAEAKLAESPFSPEEIAMLLWVTWPFVKTEWPHGRGLYTTLPPAGPECLLSARAKLEGWRS